MPSAIARRQQAAAITAEQRADGVLLPVQPARGYKPRPEHANYKSTELEGLPATTLVPRLKPFSREPQDQQHLADHATIPLRT